eukprot:384519_1
MIKYIEQQWIDLPTECQAVQTIKPSKKTTKFMRSEAPMPYRRKKGATKQSKKEEDFQIIWDDTISHIKKILSINYYLTNSALVKTIQNFDTQNIITWAASSFATSISKLNQRKHWLPQNNNKSDLMFEIFEGWCKKAKLIKNVSEMEAFIECKEKISGVKRNSPSTTF